MTLLTALRAGTRDAHDRLEDGLDVLTRCTDPTSYARLLLGFRSVYAPLERALDAAPATAVVVPDWSQRRKTGWLDEDLAALGCAPWPDAAVPPVRTAEQVLGAAYVMEGATLGGAVVLRGLPEALPHRFFASYGPRRGALWRDFRAHADALPHVDADGAVQAATEVFAAFASACLEGAA